MYTEKLTKQLPHGSGIDYPWSIERTEGFIEASNAFHAMDDVGVYCDVWPFTVRYTLSGKFIEVEWTRGDPETDCPNCGRGLTEYLTDTMPDLDVEGAEEFWFETTERAAQEGRIHTDENGEILMIEEFDSSTHWTPGHQIEREE